MTKLATTTVGVGGVSSVTFSNIPQGYTDLKVVMSAKTSDANTGTIANINFNSNTSSYSSRFSQGRGDSTLSSTGSTSAGDVGRIPGVNSPVTDNIYSNTEISILNYSSNKFKAYSSDAISEASQTIAYAIMTAGLWSNPEIITSITFTPSAGSFAQYSTFTIYGIKNARQTAGNSIKATGGNIVFDGTYVTHTFNSTGAFTPTQSLLADYLVIAGGGGGSNGNGGGGAGGFRTSIGGTALSLGLNQAYTVTVGAGGSAGLAGSVGSNSIFSTITSTGGGGGGRESFDTATTGGSGGGGGGAQVGKAGNSGGYSPSEGNAGGNGGGSTRFPGGGGGGAGGVGAVGQTAAVAPGAGGAGGVGIASSISGSSVTYAGGGGGGGDVGGVGGAGGGGAGGAASASGTAGTANTGGGGGASNGGTGGAGGSGLVIIRYKG
jgi:hypothetical protein